jgi:Lipocalin-like domain
MTTLYWAVLGAVLAITGFAQAQSSTTQLGDREKLIGAWHLVHIDSPGQNGNLANTRQPQGMLIYTRDGHVSVQLMYPKSTNASSNEYVLDGYEASFGSYEVNEAKHMLTHHVQGAITRDLLVGKDLPRVYHFAAEGEANNRIASA